MREIKFRARDKKTGEWWYGSSFVTYYDNPNRLYHMSFFWRGIEDGTLDIETLGEYMGLKDKNGKEIYEGDVVRYTHQDLPNPIDFRVVFFEGAFAQDRPEDGRYDPDLWYDWVDLEIIGNIYENKELLEEPK